MSDVFEGPGWWLASDGKWYAPHLHHDPAYRERFAGAHANPTIDVAAPTEETSDAQFEPATPIVDIAEPVDVPSEPSSNGQAMPEPVVTPVPGSVAEMLAGVDEVEQPQDVPADTIEDAEIVPEVEVATVPVVEIVPEVETVPVIETGPEAETAPPVEPVVNPEPRTSTPVSQILERVDQIRRKEAEERTGDESPEAERPKVDVAPAAESEAPDPTIAPEAAPTINRSSSSRARLELGTLAPEATVPPIVTPLEPERQPTKPPVSLGVRDENAISTSTDLVHVGPTDYDNDLPEMLDRLVAAALFVSGVAMIVGTFMTWETSARVQQSGWELGDGIATVIAGVLGSAAAGPIFVGFHHGVPRAMAIVCGLVGAVVVGLSGLQAVSDAAAAETTVGGGFWVVLIGAIAMLTTGVIDRNRVST